MPKDVQPDPFRDRTILGVRFFGGTVEAAVDRMLQERGLLVVPSGPGMATLPDEPEYRRALLTADMAITDSAYMVLLWNLLEHDNLIRISGLGYLREFFARPEVKAPGKLFFVMARPESAKKNLEWLRSVGIDVPETHLHMAPMYGDGALSDEALLRSIEELRPEHVIVTVGGGVQERLGLYLREKLSYKPGIHCIGAAIAFLSGDQTPIPVWADKMYLGWLLRIFEDPKRYGSRYWAAVPLGRLMMKYRSRLPEIHAHERVA